MTDKELTIWEHLDSVIRVLTCKEMGAWLYRRDKKVLVAELEKVKMEIQEEAKKTYKFPYEEAEGLGISDRIIDKHIAELKGE